MSVLSSGAVSVILWLDGSCIGGAFCAAVQLQSLATDLDSSRFGFEDLTLGFEHEMLNITKSIKASKLYNLLPT